MRLIVVPLFFFCAALLPVASAQTATYTHSNQTVSLTGLGGSGGVGQSRVSWGNCVYDGTNTKCTVTAPYTGVGGGGTISLVLTYGGNGISPFTANSISAGSDLIRFGLAPGASGSISVSLNENTGAAVTFLTNGFNFFFDLASCSGISASSCGVGQVGLTPGAVISGTVHGTFDQTPVIQTSLGVVTLSGYGRFPAIAPATWIEIYGANLANVVTQTWGGADFKGNAAPTALGGTSVTIGGQPAFVEYVSPGQVNAQVPSNISTGSQPVVVTTPGGISTAYPITVNVTEPGLLAPAVFNLKAGLYVTALFTDGVTYVLPPGSFTTIPTARAKPGDTIVVYGVGFGAVTPDNPAGQVVTQSNQLNGNFQASFAGIPAHVLSSSLTVGFLGLYQFDIMVPNVAASDAVPFTFTFNGTPGTQQLLIPIGN